MPNSSRLLLSESSYLLYQPELALRLGKVEAMILQHAHHWITASQTMVGKVHQGKRWIYNSYKAWAQEIKIYSEKTIYRAIKNLEAMGILLSDTLHTFRGNRTKWYTIAYETLATFLKPFLPQKAETPLEQKMSGTAMSKWSGQNDQIITEITSNTSLNRAKALETLQPLVEQELSEVVETEGEETVTPFSLEEEALQVLGIVETQLDTPLPLSKPLFRKTLAKRMRTHFGEGKVGLERFRDYCTTYASNAFLMGKKAMKSGDRFITSIGSLLSEKMIEDSWEGKGFFKVYPPKKTPPILPEEDTMGRRSDPVFLPPLTLLEVLSSAQNSLDTEVKKTLYQALGDVTYQTWFHNTGFVAKNFKNGEPDFFINSGFARNYVLTQYGDQLKKAFNDAKESLGEGEGIPC